MLDRKGEMDPEADGLKVCDGRRDTGRARRPPWRKVRQAQDHFGCILGNCDFGQSLGRDTGRKIEPDHPLARTPGTRDVLKIVVQRQKTPTALADMSDEVVQHA